ncbi:unnamed protein product [Schistosoma bovis]|nr:unnamed protein product [Schistosoma bovis]
MLKKQICSSLWYWTLNFTILKNTLAGGISIVAGYVTVIVCRYYDIWKTKELSQNDRRPKLDHLRSLTLSHNKITEIPQEISTLQTLEHLNLFNNCIMDISPKIVELTYLRSLNLGMNKLSVLPRGFGAFPSLEILDLTYNNLKETSLPDNFFNLVTLRALYLSDNDFERIPPGIGKLLNLEIVRFNILIESTN